MSRSSDILKQGGEYFVTRIRGSSEPFPPNLPAQLAEPMKSLSDWATEQARAAWRDIYQAYADERVIDPHDSRRRKYPDEAVKTLIVLVGTAVLARLPFEACDSADRSQQRYEPARPSTLLLAVSVGDVDHFLIQSPDRELTKESADELRRITRWIWHGQPGQIQQLWERVSDPVPPTSDSPYDFYLIRIDLKSSDERFDSPSAISRAEAFKGLLSSASGPFKVSGRVHSDILERIQFRRLQ